MSLESGHKLAHYEILEPIGKGGMGEVFRARDTKLKRDVAIKVLPEAFASDEERMKRFAREAEVLASLNHPNIAAIYGLEDQALVLELVEGPTLAERIAQGPIPLDEAVAIAKQMAEALEAAHEQGIVHRDLKPANVKVREDGTVKILDFGLAKALDEEHGGDASESPTMTAAATRAGVIMGTAAYMSPEQARGKRVDRRADIWAFGVVLYEMLTGKRAFEAEDVSLTLAEVMKSEPRWEALPSGVSAAMSTYLRRCLYKDPNERVRDIGDMRLALGGAFDSATAAPDSGRARPYAGVWAASVVLTVLASATAFWLLTRPAAPPVARFTVSPPPSAALRISNTNRDIAISPDGQWIAYQGIDRKLYLRHTGRFEATRLDVETPANPFFSPDGAWVGFESRNTLKKVPTLGGPPMTICRIDDDFAGATWASDGTIIFAVRTEGLFRVSADGGKPRRITTPNDSIARYGWPVMLPGGDAVLFSVVDELALVGLGPSTSLAGDYAIAALSLATGEESILIRGGAAPAYLTTGHLAYVAEDALMVVPFDPKRLQTTGDAVRVMTGLTPKFTAATNYGVSDNGVLIYAAGGPLGGDRALVWVDRNGREERLDVEPRRYLSVVLSPDGDRVATAVLDESGIPDLWIHSLSRGVTTRLTFDPGGDANPLWTPGGEAVIFRSSRDGGGLYRKRADGSGSTEKLVGPSGEWIFSITPDGQTVVGTMSQDKTTWDVSELSLQGDGSSRAIVVGPSNQWHPQISPNGNWLAYMSRESGPSEIYIRPYPDVDSGRWQVSTDGGSYPMWSPNEDELFYRTETGMFAVPVSFDDGFVYGAPVALFDDDYVFSSYRDFDVAPDGQHFLMLAEISDEGSGEDIHVVLNWFEELRTLGQ